MKLTYTITNEDYKDIISYSLRERDRTPRARIMLFLKTAGLLLLVFVLILCNPFTMKQKITLIIAAALAAAVNYFTSRAYDWKASGILSQMEKKNQIHPGFWDEHTLEPKEDGLLMTYGTTEYLLPWYNLIQPELDQNFLFIKNCQGSIVEGVPRNILSDEEIQELMEIFEKYQN